MTVKEYKPIKEAFDIAEFLDLIEINSLLSVDLKARLDYKMYGLCQRRLRRRGEKVCEKIPIAKNLLD